MSLLYTLDGNINCILSWHSYFTMSVPNPSNIFIREGLPPDVTEEQIHQYAHRQGIKDSDIIDITVHMDVAGHCAVHAYITCSSPEAAKITAAKLNGTIAAGYNLKVYHATERNYDECIPLNWPQCHIYILSRLRSMTAEEYKSFKSSLPAKISLIKDKIMFVGNQKDISKSQETVKINFISRLQYQLFTYQCFHNSECKNQIEKFVLIPLSSKLQFEYFVKDNGGGQLDIAIFSQSAADYGIICSHMQVSYSFQIYAAILCVHFSLYRSSVHTHVKAQ